MWRRCQVHRFRIGASCALASAAAIPFYVPIASVSTPSSRSSIIMTPLTVLRDDCIQAFWKSQPNLLKGQTIFQRLQHDCPEISTMVREKLKSFLSFDFGFNDVKPAMEAAS